MAGIQAQATVTETNISIAERLMKSAVLCRTDAGSLLLALFAVHLHDLWRIIPGAVLNLL